LHRLYQGLQLAPNSTLIAEKESFYAHLALDKSWGNDLMTSFDPVAEIQRIEDPISVTAIGVRAYLQAINPKKDVESSKQLAKAYEWFEQIQGNADSAISRNYKPTYLILKSLDFRMQGQLEQEKKYLEDWVDSQLDYFKFGGFTLLDQPPSLNGLNVKIIRYTIQRLIEIAPDSQAILRLAYFSIVTLNAKKDSDAFTSYSLLNASESDLSNQQIQDRIRLNANYSRRVANAYYKSAKHMINSRQKTTYDGGVNLFETYQLLEKIKISDKQLADFKNKSNPFVNLDYKDLIPKDYNTSIILFAEADGYILNLVLKKEYSKVHILAVSNNNNLSESLSILTSNKLEDIPEPKIKLASIKFSKMILGDSSSLGGHIQILSGPTVMNVPYTLLSDPNSGKWLIEQAHVEAYISSQQRDIKHKKK
jgi:hypothetical protein